MPTYEYRCTTCGHQEEVFAKISDPPPAACMKCGADTLEKVLHPVAVHYKGSGFYSTDYKSRGVKSDAGSGSDSTTASDTSSSKSVDSSSAGTAAKQPPAD